MSQGNIFVIMPFSSTKTHSASEWTKIYEHIFKPSIEECGYLCERAVPTGSPIKSIIEKLRHSTIVLADFTDANPNVFYELGVRHSLSKRTIIVAQRIEQIPTDLRGYWSIIYGRQTAEVNQFSGNLKKVISEMMENPDIPHIASLFNEENLIRSIEFPPEYHQAGLSILNYFGTILRRRYPNQPVRVRLEQEDLKVTMVIETPKGEREVIEKLLSDYSLVVQGKMGAGEFTDDTSEIVDLRNQLRIAAVQIENKRDLLKLSEATVERLSGLLAVALEARSLPSSQHIEFAPVIDVKTSSEITQDLDITQQISMMVGGLSELKEELEADSAEAKEVESAEKSLKEISEKVRRNVSPEKVQESPEMSKLRRFVVALGDEETKLGKTVKGIEKGVGIAQDIAGFYNEIAQWCGLPQVPKPFLKNGSEKKEKKTKSQILTR